MPHAKCNVPRSFSNSQNQIFKFYDRATCTTQTYHDHHFWASNVPRPFHRKTKSFEWNPSCHVITPMCHDGANFCSFSLWTWKKIQSPTFFFNIFFILKIKTKAWKNKPWRNMVGSLPTRAYLTSLAWPLTTLRGRQAPSWIISLVTLHHDMVSTFGHSPWMFHMNQACVTLLLNKEIHFWSWTAPTTFISAFQETTST